MCIHSIKTHNRQASGVYLISITTLNVCQAHFASSLHCDHFLFLYHLLTLVDRLSTRRIWSYIFSRREWLSLDIDDLWGGRCPPCDVLTPWYWSVTCHVSVRIRICDRVQEHLEFTYPNSASPGCLGYYKHLYPSQLFLHLPPRHIPQKHRYPIAIILANL